jgi:hypothetical protein
MRYQDCLGFDWWILILVPPLVLHSKLFLSILRKYGGGRAGFTPLVPLHTASYTYHHDFSVRFDHEANARKVIDSRLYCA